MGMTAFWYWGWGTSGTPDPYPGCIIQEKMDQVILPSDLNNSCPSHPTSHLLGAARVCSNVLLVQTEGILASWSADQPVSWGRVSGHPTTANAWNTSGSACEKRAQACSSHLPGAPRLFHYDSLEKWEGLDSVCTWIAPLLTDSPGGGPEITLSQEERDTWLG